MSLITRAFSLSSVRDLEIVHVLIRHSTKVDGQGNPGSMIELQSTESIDSQVQI